MPNRLIHETSPYLLQHAHNPVDWYPWGPEALGRARAENRAILLSIGYSACHWCHVMEHESFEDPATAAVMNQHFVNIKVDREERPDLDSIYMSAVQAMTGRGGWPMTMFLTPDGVPFFGGTYFPPADRGQMPSFRRVLESVADAYRTRGEDVRLNAERVLGVINRTAGHGEPGKLVLALLDEAYANIKERYDPTYGGFGGAPKFPQPMTLEFLLRVAHRTGNAEALDMATNTLVNMARGGMYDQLGGGFHRYSVDAYWLVPHFEKMLYDNALLSRAYLNGYQLTRDPFFRRVAEETLDYVQREMVSPEGAFYSTEDADSEGHEGKYYVWSEAEIDRVTRVEVRRQRRSRRTRKAAAVAPVPPAAAAPKPGQPPA
ncbi:MAG: thioredoxin domain-containing protein, partial [Chloroflexota bacterium]